MRSPSPLHIPVPVFGLRLLLLAVSTVDFTWYSFIKSSRIGLYAVYSS